MYCELTRPIQFRKNNDINLRKLKSQLDRRIDLITYMVKGMKNNKKICSDSCCQFQDNYCQTQEGNFPLTELSGNLSNISMNSSSSIKSLKSPTLLRKQMSKKGKQNNSSIKKQNILQSSKKEGKTAQKIIDINKSQKLLKSIQQSQSQALKTSRYNNTNIKNGQLPINSQKKKEKPTLIKEKPKQNSKIITKSSISEKKLISNNKNYQKVNTLKNKQKETKAKQNQKKVINSNKNNLQQSFNKNKVVNSFQSQLNKHFNDIHFHETDLNDIQSSKRNKESYQRDYETERNFVNLSLNNDFHLKDDHSQSKTKNRQRKNSFNQLLSVVTSSIIKNQNNKKQKQSLSTNNGSIINGQSVLDESVDSGPKRLSISNDIFIKIQAQFQQKLQSKKNKNQKQPRTNNIRISLLKRLEDRYQKTLQADK